MIIMEKQTELIQVMNNVANKYMKWSLAKDHFISDTINFSSQIDSDLFSGKLSQSEAREALENEITSLRKQNDELEKNQVRQAIILRPISQEKVRGSGGRETINDDLFIAGAGFIAGGLQIVTGVGMISTGAGAIPGTLLTAHGVNNLIENGYYLLYRESCTGPVRFMYEEAGDFFGIDIKDSDVIYTFVDVALSMNGLLEYKLPEEAQRLYRYINADLLWGIKKMGITLMGPGDLFIEITGDINTVVGQWRAY